MQAFFDRHAVKIVVLVGLLFPLTVVCGVLALGSNRNDVEEWLPDSFPETRDYKDFRAHFSNDTFILASWDGCTLDDPRLDALAEELTPQGDSTSADPPLLRKVVTGRGIVQQLMDPPVKLTREQAARRLERSLVGPDLYQTCAVLTLSDAGKADLHATLRTVLAATDKCGIPRDTLRMGGPPIDNATIDEEGERMLLPLMSLSAGVGLGLAWWYMRNLALTAMVFVGGVYAAAISLALVQITGGQMNSILLTMPSVVYTAGLACAIHIVNYYKHTRAVDGDDGAVGRAIRLAWLPCTLSAGTTSIGLISLCTSEIVPIRYFGLYSAAGVMVTIVFMFMYLPAALSLWPPPLPKAAAGHGDIEDAPPLDAIDPRHRRQMRWLATRIIARPILIWTVFLLLLAACGTGLQWGRTTVNLMSLFSPNAKIIHDYRWLEDRLGPLVPMEVVVRIDDKACPLNFLERMELVQRLQRAIEKIPHVGSTMSPATFAIDLGSPKKSGFGGALMNPKVWRGLLNRRLLAHKDDFLTGDYLAEDRETGEQLWRISLRVAALEDIDYGDFIKSIEKDVQPIVDAERAAGVQGITGVTYTGLTPVVYRAERALLNGLIESFFWAFVMIAGVMSVVYRDLRAGLYTMLPNVWPVIVVFGLMSWFGIALDIGTMMTASVAMGVCVDDTVHFANWFRRATLLGLDRRAAAVLAYENSAGAIYQSTVIVALGLVTFALSSFMPTQRFGYLMCGLLTLGLIADLVLTPAMLAGHVGRYFTVGCRVPGRKTHLSESTEPASEVV